MTLTEIILIFSSFIGLLFVILIGKKIYYRLHLKKRFFIIPRVGTNGIANIGMILGLSIAMILFLILVTANIASIVFRLWAGTRILVEGVLIKIGGLLFGPIIGMCLGAAIDILTITYSGGIFHFGYLMSAILFGLIGGLINMLVISTRDKELRFSIYSTLLTAVIIAISLIPILIGSTDKFLFSILNLNIELSRDAVLYILVVFPAASMLIMWLIYWIYIYKLKKNPNMKKWYMNFAPVFVTIIITEIIINIVMMPYFDSIISPLSYDAWFMIRLALFIPMVILNVVIVYPVYSIIKPNMKYKYEDELVEPIKDTIYID